MGESRQERWASSVVATRLGVDLRFVDTDGRVDYRFTDPAGRLAAMEVTTLTDEKFKGSVAAYAKTPNSHTAADLESCWSVGVDERDARFKGLQGRLGSHLLTLERAGVKAGRWLTPSVVRFEYGAVRWRSDLELAARVDKAVVAFRQEKVHLLMRWLPAACGKDDVRRGLHEHELHVSTSGDFVEVGAAVALSAIETFVQDNVDNLEKLATSRAEVKHLFVCLDDQSSASITHSVSRRFAAPAVAGADYFGVPRRPPALPSVVDELWVVYEREGEGWHWDGVRWEQLDGGR